MLKPRHQLIGLSLLGVIVFAIRVSVIPPFPLSSTPAYNPAQVQQGLQRQPRAWIGRTILVRGVVGGWAAAQCPGRPWRSRPGPHLPIGCRSIVTFLDSMPHVPGVPGLSVRIPSQEQVMRNLFETNILDRGRNVLQAILHLTSQSPSNGSKMLHIRLLPRPHCSLEPQCPDAVFVSS